VSSYPLAAANIVKSRFGKVFKSFIFFQDDSSYSQVLKTSTDPEPKFSAPFKAGTFRQVQTCLQINIIYKLVRS